MAKAGCHRQGEFVALCLQIESGEQPGDLAIEPVLRDIFALTERQARIADTIARAGGARCRADAAVPAA